MMTDGSVKDILAKFNQGNGPQIGVVPRPRVGTKPNVLAKPSAISKDSAASNGIKSPSPAQPGKPGTKPRGPQPPQLNISEIATVKLKKSPVPRIPNEKPSTETPAFVNKPFPKPKPKPGVLPRGDSSAALTSSSSSPVPQSPSFTTPSKPPKPHSALHPSPSSEPIPNPDRTPPVPSPKDKKPRPPPPSRKDSLHKDEQVSPSPSPKPSFLNSQRLSIEDSRNSHWRNGVGAEDPPPPVSDSENSSASSIPDMPPRRTSFLHTNKVLHSKPSLQPLPPLMAIGPAPRKPAKPPNVSLARFTSSKLSAPHRPPKPGLQSPPPPSLPARPSIPIGVGGAKPRPSPPVPVAEEAEDSGEIYDDVEGNPPPPPPVTRRRPVSLIRPMDSDEEDAGEEGGFDEIYDDAESTSQVATAPPPLPPSVPHHHPKVVVTGSGDAAPPLPSISSIPAYHGSGGSNVSFPRSAEHSGSGLEDAGEIYDDVTNEAEGDFDELYEALDVSEDRNFQSSSTEVDAASEQEMRKQEERRKKEEERLRKEQEKQQRQEEERRKKKEREEKKKKEKEEKDIKKKFKIKGDISIIDEGIVMETMEAIYEKHDLKCSRGERIEILRKEGNPPGKWLARNPDGHYGYVDQQFVRVEGGGGGDADSGEVYDDVIGGEDEELEEDNIYDAVN